MNQCVPSWDLDEPVGEAGLNPVSAGAHRVVSAADAFTPVIVPMSERYYDVEELTWDKGNISSHGLLNRPEPKYPPASSRLQAIGSSGGGDMSDRYYEVAELTWEKGNVSHRLLDRPEPKYPPASSRLQAIGSSGGGDMSDRYYEVAELTWEKGNVSHRLLDRPEPKYPPASSHPQAIGSNGGGDRETLEAVVGEAAARSAHLAHPVPAPWLGVAPEPVDALVPCARDEARWEARGHKRARVLGEDGRVCASQGSAAPGRGESTPLTLEAYDVYGFTTTTNNSTSLEREDKGYPETENTSIGGGASDSRCFSRRSKGDGLCDEGGNAVIKGEAKIRSSVSTKRSQAAAIHNESERKRRDRIKEKMKTLQKLVPNASKTDKASMLDEVIDYLKQLQAQLQVMSRVSSMMMPMAMPQLQMSVMANMAQMAQMGLGMMNMSPLAQPGYAGLTRPMSLMHPSPFVPVPRDAAAAADRPQPPAGSAVPDALSTFLACQSAQHNAQQQPSSMEAYNRMVALCQQLNQQQQQQSNSKQ